MKGKRTAGRGSGWVGLGVGVSDGYGVRVMVGVFDGRGVMVFAGVDVWVGVGVGVIVGVRVCVDEAVIVAVWVTVGEGSEPQAGILSKAAVRSIRKIALFAGVKGIASFQVRHFSA